MIWGEAQFDAKCCFHLVKGDVKGGNITNKLKFFLTERANDSSAETLDVISESTVEFKEKMV